MFRNISFKMIVAVVVFSACSAVAFSQTAPVSGTVKLKKGDGTTVPAAGVNVDAYRTDIDKGKMPGAKTNKKGEFSFVGFMLGQTYAIVVSGPGISPELRPNIRAGTDGISIEVNEGDGKTWTEDEVRTALKSASSQGGTGELTAEQKKEQADYLKKKAEYDIAKKKAEDANKIVNAAFQEGDKLYKAKDYAGAIAKFDEGINADPDFEGSAPILLNYKAVALKDRGFNSYKQSLTGDDAAKAAGMEKAKSDFHDAISAIDRGLLVIKNAPATTDTTTQKSAESSKRDLLANYVEIFRIMVKSRADVSMAKQAGPVFEQYFTVEPDAAKKTAAKLTLGDIMQEAGETQAALDAYMAVLTASPDNLDALAGAGFSLVNLGYLNNDKTKFQEAVNYLQRFIAGAPDTNKYKADAISLIDTLKKEQNVTPQKSGAAPKKKGQ